MCDGFVRHIFRKQAAVGPAVHRSRGWAIGRLDSQVVHSKANYSMKDVSIYIDIFANGMQPDVDEQTTTELGNFIRDAIKHPLCENPDRNDQSSSIFDTNYRAHEECFIAGKH